MYATTLPRSNWLRRASIRLAWYRHMPASSWLYKYRASVWWRVIKTRFSRKLSNLQLWCLLTTYIKSLHGLYKEPILGPLGWPWASANLAPWPTTNLSLCPAANPVKTTPMKLMLTVLTYSWRPKRVTLVDVNVNVNLYSASSQKAPLVRSNNG